MKEYESPKAEYLHLDDVIASSSAIKPCKCVRLESDGSVPPGGGPVDLCPTNDTNDVFETLAGA